MLNPITIPKGVAKILMVGNYTSYLITEEYEHRPDLVLEKVNKKSVSNEIINNYMNDISPIHLSKNSIYNVMGNNFIGYFGAI